MRRPYRSASGAHAAVRCAVLVTSAVSSIWAAAVLGAQSRAPRIAEMISPAARVVPPPRETDPSDYQRFGTELDSLRLLLRTPGLAAAISRDGHIVWTNASGFADLEHRRPVTQRTLFPIASITKTMTAVVTMQLVEEGRLRLDDRVDSIDPASSLPRDVQISDLLSHTSEMRLDGEYLYSGQRFDALGRIVERATGRPLNQVLRRRIFGPAEMTATVALSTTSDTASVVVAKPYDLDETSPTGVRPGTPAVHPIRAASGVISTVVDLAKYGIALDGRRLLDSAATIGMTTPGRSARGVRRPYAFGWFSQVYLGEQLWWHFGQEQSYASLLLWLPQRHLMLAVLANSAVMSNAARLLEGNVAGSLIAQSFFRTILHLGPNSVLRRDDEIATALVDSYVGASAKADTLTRLAFAQSPELAHRPNPALLFLLISLRDRALETAAKSITDTLLRAHPTLPQVLYYGSVAAIQAADTARAAALLEELAECPTRRGTMQ